MKPSLATICTDGAVDLDMDRLSVINWPLTGLLIIMEKMGRTGRYNAITPANSTECRCCQLAVFIDGLKTLVKPRNIRISAE